MLYNNLLNHYRSYYNKKNFDIVYLQNYLIHPFSLKKKSNNKINLSVNNYKTDFFNKNYYFFKKINPLIFGLFFLFIIKYDFFSFLVNFKKAYQYLYKIFFCRLKLRGLGYSLKRYNRFFFCFFMAVSNFFYFHVPFSIFIKKRKKYIVMISYNRMQLNLLF
jgi:hypothetical protein